LEKEILSATSKDKHCAGDLLGVIPTPPGIYLRLFSPLWHLVSEGDTYNKECRLWRDPEAHRCLLSLRIVVDEASPRGSSVS
jgi:hypothetical protein